MMNQKSYLVVTVLLLNGCATNPNTCDPRTPGFISGISAMASGCYKQRISERQQEVSDNQELNEELHTENRALVAEKQLTSSQKNQAQRNLATLQNKNAELERRIRSMKANTASRQSEKLRLQKRLLQVNAKSENLQKQINSGTITEKELLLQQQSLNKEAEESANALAEAMLVQ